MFIRSLFAISILALTACSDDGGGGTPDAPRADAQTSRVMEVTCPVTPAATFVTQDSSFNPQTATINVGQIVRFQSNRNDHPIGPIVNDPLSDPDLRVSALQTKCFMFLATGMFKFQCLSHGYAGTLTVN